ncbi:MAG: polysaccharide biosynthesis tyrosine autokinase [Calothrix sp. MO_167.B42]|nr:polysaccharide biosynthesis tyrosine autokinase [Calothrix sp. MO_167.B42]
MEPSDSSLIWDKYWQVVKRRWIPGLGVFFPVCVVSVLAASWKKPAYEAVGKLLFHKTNTIASPTGVEQESGGVKSDPANDRSNPLDTEVEVISSTVIVQKTIDHLKLKDSEGKFLSYQAFLDRLTVKNIPGTNVVQVAYVDSNPELAAQVVTTLMDKYLDYKESTQKAQAVSARQFIEKQLPKEELVIRQAEAKLADFKEKNNIISLQEEATKSVEMIADLQQKIGTIKAQMANVSAQAKEIRAQLGMSSQQAAAFNSLSQAEGIQSLFAEIQQLESQLANKRTVFQSNHPEIKNLESKLNTLKKILKERIEKVSGAGEVNPNGNLQIGELQQQQWAAKLVELESIRLGWASELATLSTLDARYRLRVNNIPRLEKEQRQLERQVNAAQSTYLHLLQKLQKARIAENQPVNNVSQISVPTVVPEPISDRKIYYQSGVLLSGLIALVTMCILEVRDKTIKTVEEAKQLLEIPVLGVIPLWKQWQKLPGTEGNAALSLPMVAMRDVPRSPMGEAYRMLRANLKFASADKETKVVLVTSSVPKEGKSTVAANLAMAMTQAEHSVLLVDGDLYRPSQHLIWNLPNHQGLSNVILKEVEVMKAIKKVSNNLYVLTSGAIPFSPASVSDSQRMASLLDSFAAYYDYVIIDAPALNLVVDAATLGQMADGVLLVVRPGVVDYKNAIAACELLAKSGQNVLGQVVNAVASDNENLNYYFQGAYELEDKTLSQA